MRIVFFGIASAVPCVAGGSNTSFLVAGDEGTVLVDCSGDPVLHLARAGVAVRDLDALVLTHRHTDHVYAVPNLLQSMRLTKREKPLTVAGNAPTLDFVRRLIEHFNQLEREDAPDIRWTDVEAEPAQTLAGFRFDFHETRHSIPCHGFTCSDGKSSLIHGADGAPDPDLASRRPAGSPPVLVHESTGPHRNVERLNEMGHSSARQAGEAALGLGAARLFLSHLGAATAEGIEALRREAEVAAGGIATEVPVIDLAYEI